MRKDRQNKGLKDKGDKPARPSLSGEFRLLFGPNMLKEGHLLERNRPSLAIICLNS